MHSEEEKDDVSAVPYTRTRIDYMRDVFRPKVFVPASTTAPPDRPEETTPSPAKGNEYKSVYDGIYDLQDMETTACVATTERFGVEEEQAKQLFQRVQEIEKRHEGEAPQSPIEDSSLPRFENKRCGCVECSPRFDGNGAMYCGLCSVPLRDGSWVCHTQSICHQLKRKRGEHVYINPFMDPSSVMWKVMTEMGWEEGAGLGADGKGRLEPIPTRMKNNRLGVGARDLNPLRVTHTEQNEDPEVARARERLLKKYGPKRLKRLIARYNKKKKALELRKREEWLREEFRL